MGLPYITPRVCDLFRGGRATRSVRDLSQAALSYRFVGAWSSEGNRGTAEFGSYFTLSLLPDRGLGLLYPTTRSCGRGPKSQTSIVANGPHQGPFVTIARSGGEGLELAIQAEQRRGTGHTSARLRSTASGPEEIDKHGKVQ